MFVACNNGESTHLTGSQVLRRHLNVLSKNKTIANSTDTRRQLLLGACVSQLVSWLVRDLGRPDAQLAGERGHEQAIEGRVPGEGRVAGLSTLQLQLLAGLLVSR